MSYSKERREIWVKTHSSWSQDRRDWLTLEGICYQCCKRLISSKSRFRCTHCIKRSNLKGKLRSYSERQNEHLKARYGITITEYNDMVASRAGCCDICHLEPKGHHKKLNVDHNSATNEIRGLLCWQCNIAIGYMKHDSDRLTEASKYLNRGTSN